MSHMQDISDTTPQVKRLRDSSSCGSERRLRPPPLQTICHTHTTLSTCINEACGEALARWYPFEIGDDDPRLDLVLHMYIFRTGPKNLQGVPGQASVTFAA